MAEKVKLILARPERIAKEGYYAGVIIPAFADYLTVIPGRAPSMIWLQPGMVQLLNDNMEVVEKYFIGNGAAEIAGDVCTISAEKVIAKADINLSEACERLEAATEEADKAFYQVIYDELTGFPDKR